MSQEYIRQYRAITAEISNLDIPLIDDFESSLVNWYIETGNTSGGATRDTTKAFRGNASLKLDTGATTPAQYDYVYISKYIGSLREKIIHFKIRFRRPYPAPSQELLVGGRLINRDTLKTYQAYIKVVYNGTKDTIQYINNLGQWITITEMPTGLAPDAWHTIEFVINIETGKYIYAVVNGLKYDIFGAAPYEMGVAEGDSSTAEVSLTTTQAAQAIINIDDVIICHERI